MKMAVDAENAESRLSVCEYLDALVAAGLPLRWEAVDGCHIAVQWSYDDPEYDEFDDLDAPSCDDGEGDAMATSAHADSSEVRRLAEHYMQTVYLLANQDVSSPAQMDVDWGDAPGTL